MHSFYALLVVLVEVRFAGKGDTRNLGDVWLNSRNHARLKVDYELGITLLATDKSPWCSFVCSFSGWADFGKFTGD